MNREELGRRLLELLLEIAPDVDASTVIPAVNFRDQFDFDSMDTLNFAIALERDLGVQVPESDYARLASLDKCIDYCLPRLGSAAPRA